MRNFIWVECSQPRNPRCVNSCVNFGRDLRILINHIKQLRDQLSLGVESSLPRFHPALPPWLATVCPVDVDADRPANVLPNFWHLVTYKMSGHALCKFLFTIVLSFLLMCITEQCAGETKCGVTRLAEYHGALPKRDGEVIWISRQVFQIKAKNSSTGPA